MTTSSSSSASSSRSSHLLRRFLFLVVGAGAAAAAWFYQSRLFPSSSPAEPAPPAPEFVQQSPATLYRRPFKLPSSTTKQIVYVVFLGQENPALIQKALNLLPEDVTIAISPHTPHAPYWAQQFHQKGHEILVSLGLEPEHFPLNDPGPYTLLTGLSPAAMEKRLNWALERVPYAVGITHETGTLFTVQKPPMKRLFELLRARQMFFLDTVASPYTVSAEVAAQEKVQLLTVDRPFSPSTLPSQKATELREKALREGRLVVTLPLCGQALSVIEASQKETSPAIALTHTSFALENEHFFIPRKRHQRPQAFP